MKTVIMAESSDIYHDYRVQKEAESLVGAGYKVLVYGFRSPLRAPDKTFPFSLRTLPVAPRRFRKLRNLTMIINIMFINLLILFHHRDFYHAHNTMFLPGMHLGSRLHRGRFVYDAHEVQWEHGRAQTILEEKYIHRADAVIIVSAGRARASAERFGLPLERITIVSNYPVASTDEPPPHVMGDGPIRIIFSGGFNLESNRLDLFLEAMHRVPGVDLTMMAFGYRDGEEVMKRMIQELGLGDRVRFLPLVSPDQVMTIVQQYDAALNLLTNPHNHISVTYCSTNKMYEYMAAGVPVLCSDLQAFLDEFVQPGAAISVDADDVDSITEGLQKLVAGRDRLPEMRRTARTLSLERYNWSTQEEALLGMYAFMDRSD